VAVNLKRKVMSREEMMQELTTMRKVVRELEQILVKKGIRDELKYLVDKYKKDSHDLANRIQVLECQRLGLIDEVHESIPTSK
jgi:hypothetical protein